MQNRDVLKKLTGKYLKNEIKSKNNNYYKWNCKSSVMELCAEEKESEVLNSDEGWVQRFNESENLVEEITKWERKREETYAFVMFIFNKISTEGVKYHMFPFHVH